VGNVDYLARQQERDPQQGEGQPEGPVEKGSQDEAQEDGDGKDLAAVQAGPRAAEDSHRQDPEKPGKLLHAVENPSARRVTWLRRTSRKPWP
jgi:hypothetical protein